MTHFISTKNYLEKIVLEVLNTNFVHKSESSS